MDEDSNVKAEKPRWKLPVKAAFEIGGTYLNAAFTHPLPVASAEAMHQYALSRTGSHGNHVDTVAARDTAIKLFGELVGADVDELAWVPSTTAGENMVVNALGLRTGGRVVTDSLHFEGSLYLYSELAAHGRPVTVVQQHGGQVLLDELDKAIVPGTTLVAISLVSTLNGFQHDLRAVCDIAHAKGAMVYADIIQAAGTTPIDLHASKVDFASCASYKWLMGDFGAGFLYVRRDRQGALTPHQQSYRQLQSFASHQFPFDAPGDAALSYRKRQGAGALFEVGTLSATAAVAMKESLALLLDIGVERIEKHRQPMLQVLHEEMPALGFIPLTPRSSESGIVTFAMEGVGQRYAKRLQTAQVNVQLYANRLRVSPSIYNDLNDVERLLHVLRTS